MTTHGAVSPRDLGATAFGAALSRSARGRIAAIARHRTIALHEEIDREGDQTRQFGIVRRGRVALRTHVPGRGDVTTMTVEPGDVFGWSSLLPPHRATATAVVIDRVDAIVMEAADIREALASDEGLAAEVYPLILRAVARRLAATRLQLLDVFAADPSARW